MFEIYDSMWLEEVKGKKTSIRYLHPDTMHYEGKFIFKRLNILNSDKETFAKNNYMFNNYTAMGPMPACPNEWKNFHSPGSHGPD